MARLRHFAVCVKDLDKAAEFYAKVFDLKRVGREDLEIGSAIYMTDGVINLALLNFTGAAGGKASDIKEGANFVGAHHFGFQVDDVAETQKRIEAHGILFKVRVVGKELQEKQKTTNSAPTATGSEKRERNKA